MSIEEMKQIVDKNWDLVSSCVVGAIVAEDNISYVKSEPRHPIIASMEYVTRPRVFEDESLYPVKKRSYRNMVVRYSRESNRFKSETGPEWFFESDFSFIGKKLPDSLWGDQS